MCTPCVSIMIWTLASAFFMNYFAHRQKLLSSLSSDMDISYAFDQLFKELLLNESVAIYSKVEQPIIRLKTKTEPRPHPLISLSVAYYF